jgi:hypothetical protein
MRAAAVLAPLALVAIGCGGGEDPQRAAVRGYLTRVNAVQANSRADLARANVVLRGYAQGKPIGAGALQGVEADIRAARAKVAAVQPPARARDVHTRLLTVYDLDAGLAHETLRMVRYQDAAPLALAPLSEASTRLRHDLKTARQPATQARALQHFRTSVKHTLTKLEALDVPVLLAPAHRAQVHRLQATRRLSAELRSAVLHKDSQKVAKLLLKFRRTSRTGPSQHKLSKRGIAGYTARLHALVDAQIALARAQANLNKSFRT